MERWDQAPPVGTHPALAPRGALHPPRGWWRWVSVSLSVSPRAGIGGAHGWDPFGCSCPLGRDPTGDPVAAGSHPPCSVHPRTGSGPSQDRLGTVPAQYRDYARSPPSSAPEQYRDHARTVPGQYLNHLWTWIVSGLYQDCTGTMPGPDRDRDSTGPCPAVTPGLAAITVLLPCPGVPIPVPGAGRGGRCPRPGALPPLPAGTAGTGRDGTGRGGGGSGAR